MMPIELDVIGVGCRRCASSFLHKCLNNHPDIVKPQRGLHYFSENYHLGKAWYTKQMPKNVDQKVLIESSVSYSYPECSELAAQRIFEQFPNIKIFASLRNPIERAFSDYLRSIRNLEIPSNLKFEQAINDYPEFLERGRYKKLLAPYYERYSNKCIYIFLFDDLINEPEESLSSFYKFIGETEYVAQIDENILRETSGNLRYPWFQASILSAKKVLDSMANIFGMEKMWLGIKAKAMRPYQVIRNMNTQKISISDSTRKKLYEYYKEDITWVSDKTGRCLKEWK